MTSGHTLNDIQKPQRSEATVGVMYGLAAYLWWGFCPIYFKAVAHVPPLEILAHRILWSVVLLTILIRVSNRWGVAIKTLRDRRTMLTLLCTTILIAVNWFTFIWAIANNQLMEASLGYFINPLVNVLLGFVFLRERLRPWQWVSVIVAAIGVGYRTISMGELPVVTMILAVSFSFYGLLRKTARVDSLVGLMVETSILFPLALVFVVQQAMAHTGSFGAGLFDASVLVDASNAIGVMGNTAADAGAMAVDSLVDRARAAGPLATSLLLMLGGVITAIPLLCFTNAARRLRYSTIGFMQYIAPTFQFLLAVAVYGELFTRAHMISFAFIWMALVIYSVDTVRVMRRG